jgi:hypothetical protein
VTTLRSSAKPFQVEPLVASGGYDALGLSGWTTASSP